MQSNTITLPVDLANTGSTTDAVFTRVEEYLNRSVYKSATHSLLMRDLMAFYRSVPKKSGNFNGVAKSAVKFTVDKEVEGVDSSTTVIAPLIGEISFSVPLGTTAAEAMELRQRMIAALDNDTIMVKLMEELEV